jgi:hypothetical protein
MARTEVKAEQENVVYFADVYERLAQPFDTTFKDVRGGVELEYITGEQAVSRLNEVLGVAGWSVRVLEHGYNQEADEIWVLAELTATLEGTAVVRQQFGSQKVRRSRTTDSPLDIGFDLKGATTDALKKCASLVGVGLYLSRKEAPAEPTVGMGTAASSGRGGGQLVSLPNSGDSYTCEQCDEELKEIRFRDGTTWTPALLASYGRRKHGKVLCMQHYREANESRKKAEQAPAPALDEVPF